MYSASAKASADKQTDDQTPTPGQASEHSAESEQKSGDAVEAEYEEVPPSAEATEGKKDEGKKEDQKSKL